MKSLLNWYKKNLAKENEKAVKKAALKTRKDAKKEITQKKKIESIKQKNKKSSIYQSPHYGKEIKGSNSRGSVYHSTVNQHKSTSAMSKEAKKTQEKEWKGHALSRGILGTYAGIVKASPISLVADTTVKDKKLAKSKAFKAGEFVGETGTYLTGYGGVDKLATKGAEKALASGLGKKAVKSAAKNKLVRKGAEKALTSAGKKVTEAGIEKGATEAAKKLVKGAAKDVIGDLTAGTLIDTNMAYSEGHKIGSKEYAKDMAINAAGNLVLGGAAEALPVVKNALKSNKADKKVVEVLTAKGKKLKTESKFREKRSVSGLDTNRYRVSQKSNKADRLKAIRDNKYSVSGKASVKDFKNDLKAKNVEVNNVSAEVPKSTEKPQKASINVTKDNAKEIDELIHDEGFVKHITSKYGTGNELAKHAEEDGMDVAEFLISKGKEYRFEKQYNKELDELADYIYNYKGQKAEIVFVPNKDRLEAGWEANDGFGYSYRSSTNEQWYREALQRYGHKPNKKQSRELAEEILDNDLRAHEDGHETIFGEVGASDDLKALFDNLPEADNSQVYKENKELLGDLFDEDLVGIKDMKAVDEVPDRPLKDLGADVNHFKTEPKKSTSFANEVLDEPYMYEPETHKQRNYAAEMRVEMDKAGETNELLAKENWTSEDTATMAKIIDDSPDASIEEKNKLWEKVAEQSSKAGQELEAFKHIKEDTPDGKLYQAHKTVVKSRKEVEKANPKLAQKVEEEAKEITDAINKAAEEARKETDFGKILKSHLTDSGESAKPHTNNTGELITSHVNESGEGIAKSLIAKGKNAETTVKSEFARIKRSILAVSKDTDKKAKSLLDDINELENTINNFDKFERTLEQAKTKLRALINEKRSRLPLIPASLSDDAFIDYLVENGEIPREVADFLSKDARTLKDEIELLQIDKVINKVVKELDTSFSKLVKSNAGTKEMYLATIKDTIMKNMNISEIDTDELAQRIYGEYQKNLSEASQKYINNILKEKGIPKEKATILDKILEQINAGVYDSDTVLDLIREKNNIPTLTRKEAQLIQEYMENMEKATDEYEKKMWKAKAEQIIADKENVTTEQKFRGLQRISLLCNPKTLISRNAGGNILLMAAENIKDIPASIIDYLVSLKTGTRTTAGFTLDKLKSQASGFKKGVKEWGKDVKNGVETSASRSKYELPSGRTFKSKSLNRIDNFTRRALQLGDRPFYESAYKSRFDELSKLVASGKSNLTKEEIVEEARKFALDRVFQSDTPLSRSAGKLRTAMNEMFSIPLGDLIIPFTQTPANIVDKLLDYSPVGVARMMKELGHVSKGTFDQKHFVDVIGRNLTGTGVIMLGYKLAKDGIITGDTYDADNQKMARANSFAGEQSYSFLLDGKYYSFDWASPIGNLLILGTQAQQSGLDTNNMLDTIGGATTAMVDGVFSQSFLSGVTNMMSGYSPATGIAKAVLGSSTQITPSVTAKLAGIIDPVKRETYDPSMVKQSLNNVVSRTPFLSKTLPAKIDITGQEVLQNQGRGLASKLYEGFLSPSNISAKNSNIVNDELRRLYNQTGESGVLLPGGSKKFVKNGKEVTLTAEQYEKYQKTLGQSAYEKISDLVNSDRYEQMSETEKADAIKKINDACLDKAKREAMISQGYTNFDFYTKEVKAKQKQSGLNKTEFTKVYDAQAKYDKGTAKAAAMLSKEPMTYKQVKNINKGVSKRQYDNGVRLVNANISAKKLEKAAKAADYDKNRHYTRDELITYLNGTSYSREQKRAIFAALANWNTNNPY